MPVREETEGSRPTDSPHECLLFNRMLQGVLYLDADGNVVSVNPAAERILGRSQAEICGRTLASVEHDAIHEDGSPFRPDDHPPIIALNTGREQRDIVMGLFNAREEGRRWISMSALPLLRPASEPCQVYVLFDDISDRKRSEDALRASEVRFRNLFESMDEGFALCELIEDEHGRAVDLRFNEVNAAYAKIMGVPIEHIVGHAASELFPEISAASKRYGIEAAARVVRSGQSERMDYYVPELGKYYEVYAWRSEVDRCAFVCTDVTQRKRAEEALREADRRKTEFLGMLSHELRNPLAAARNALWLLERAEAGSQQAAQAGEIIKRQVLHLTRIVEDLLDVTRISRGKVHIEKTRVDLVDLVRRTAQDQQPLFSAMDVGLQLQLGELPLWIEADATRIGQAIGNVLLNAAKFSETGGRVVVDVNRCAGGMAIVRVKDEGVGIPGEIVQRIFEPFFQADTSLARSQGGLGLGLPLAKGLVELHGGCLEARSDGPGHGAEFLIRLPLAAELPAVNEAPRYARRGMASRRVLVIEDNADAAETLREVLLTWGHDVDVAFDGRSGIERARAFRPELVLCDIGLPEMDGYEVARTMRSDPALRAIYLVAVTGYASVQDQRKAADAGFDRHLAKPVSIDAIEETVATAPRPSHLASG